MADYSSKPAAKLAAIKASVIVMTILIAVGLGVIAAKLILGSGTDGTQSPASGAASVPFPRVVHLAGAGNLVVMVIETGSGEQLIRILDPATGAIEEQPIKNLVRSDDTAPPQP